MRVRLTVKADSDNYAGVVKLPVLFNRLLRPPIPYDGRPPATIKKPAIGLLGVEGGNPGNIREKGQV